MEIGKIYTWINLRIKRYEDLLKFCKMTPRLKSRLESSIGSLKSTKQNLELDGAQTVDESTIDYLKKIEVAVDSHWKFVYGDMLDTSVIFNNVLAIETFLDHTLQEDYCRKPNSSIIQKRAMMQFAGVWGSPEDRETLIRTFARVRLRGDDDGPAESADDIYERSIGKVINEMLLDRQHVEDKLRAVHRRRDQSGSNVQELIDARKWEELAKTLCGDTTLVNKVVAKDHRNEVMTAINKVVRKYYKSIRGPTDYTLSLHTEELNTNAAKANQSVVHDSESPPAYSDLTGANRSQVQDSKGPDQISKEEIQSSPRDSLISRATAVFRSKSRKESNPC
ncbi:hypothetical protein MMC06_003596 [Schaereria dolodes]|nr:hypothetical protein [Schaereria dolodes]